MWRSCGATPATWRSISEHSQVSASPTEALPRSHWTWAVFNYPGWVNSFPYSREVLVASVDGDEEVVREVIRLYLDSAPGLISAISGALKKEDAAAAADAAHSLKGALMMLRAHPAAGVAKEIELAIRSGDWGTARVKFPVLDAEAKRLASALLAGSSSPRVG